MIALLAGTFRWALRNLATLVVIALVLYVGNYLCAGNCLNFVNRELPEVVAAHSSLSVLQKSFTELQGSASQAASQVEQRLKNLPRDSAEEIESRLKHMESEISTRKAAPRKCTNLTYCAVRGRWKDIVADYQREVETRLLVLERDSLVLLVDQRKLESLRVEHERAYRKLKDESPQVARPLCPRNPDSLRARLPTRFSESLRLHLALCRENARAFRAYTEQKGRIRKLESASDVAEKAVAPVREQMKRVEADLTRTGFRRVLHGILSWLPEALLILIAALLAPPAIRAFLYYVIAPLASRRPPIQILPSAGSGDSGSASDLRSDSSTVPLSSVSRAVEVDADHELLVHSDYLQSSGTGAGKDTKWLLHAGYPLASLAAGMTVLTRIRPTGSELVVVSSTTDPLSEMGVLTLKEGDALVLQPHYLVGILQSRARPVGITSHWRLGSLSAWLTLQLRYLVFHGPGSLIVRGSRGIRVESAGRGRLINQAATMGFSANLRYAVTRSETFVPYLQGKQGLFNDRFAGSPGFYVYEEMPYAGKKAGVTGRGVDVLLDSFRKVFGI